MVVFEGYRRSVGHFHQDVRLKAKKSRTVRMFVDTGATYSIIPDDVARAIGLVRPERSILMTLADGRRKRFQAGVATFGIEGRTAPGIVLVVTSTSRSSVSRRSRPSVSPSIRSAESSNLLEAGPSASDPRRPLCVAGRRTGHAGVAVSAGASHEPAREAGEPGAARGGVAVVDVDKPTAQHGTPPGLLQCEMAAVGYRQIDHISLAPADGYLSVFAPPAALPAPESIKPCRT